MSRCPLSVCCSPHARLQQCATACSVVPAQAPLVSFDAAARFQPVKAGATTGILVLVDSTPGEAIDYVEKQSLAAVSSPATAAEQGAAAPAAAAADAVAEPEAPDDMDLEEA